MMGNHNYLTDVGTARCPQESGLVKLLEDVRALVHGDAMLHHFAGVYEIMTLILQMG